MTRASQIESNPPVLRLAILRSDSELLISMFRSEKRMGLLMQSDFAKSDGIKSDLRIRWPKSSDFGPKSEDSTHRIINSKKWHPSLIKSRPGTAAVLGTRYTQEFEHVAIDALDYKCNHNARTQSPRLTAARLQLAVGRRGLGSREQGDQRTRPASVVATYRTRVYTKLAARAGPGCFVEKKYHVERLGMSLRGQIRV